MKITYVAKNLNVDGGGSNQSLDLLARSMIDRGHDVNIVTIKPALNNPPRDRSYDFFERPSHPTPVGSAYSVKKILDEFDPQTDLFHLFSPALLTGGGMYKSLNGSKPVVGRLNSYSFCPSLYKMDDECYKNCTTAAKFIHDDSNIARKVLSLPFFFYRTNGYPETVNTFDKFFAISPAVKKIYSEIGLSESLIEVIPNFIDPDFTVEPEDYSIGEASQLFNILYVGRLSKDKGVDILIRAMSELHPSATTGIQLDIVGDGPQRQELETLATSASIHDLVRFHGHVPYKSVPKFYAQADVFVHPGLLPEPFGRAILEAMQFNCVPVVSNIGGPPWVVGKAGITFERGSVSDLVESLHRLISNDSLYERKRSHCHERVNRFSINRITQSLENEYQELLE